MNYARTPLRPGLTAIAAVLALSSTPALAQSAETAPAAPPIVTPPPVALAAPPSSAPAAAPASSAPAPVSVDLGADAAAAPEPAAPAPVTRAAAPRTVEAEPRIAAGTLAAAPETQVPVAVAPPVAAEAASAPVAAATPAAAPAEPPAATPVAANDASGDVLPIAGAGAAILLLAGGAFALSRRRRTEDGEAVYASDTIAAPADPAPMAMAAAPMMPAPAAQPAAYAAPPMSPRYPEEVSATVPVTEIPAGFDMSRFGRHTQAAYRGPTPENPSLSLKRRLKRANFFDQRERMAARGEMPASSHTSPGLGAAPAKAERYTDHITTKAPRQPRPTFRPAYQS